MAIIYDQIMSTVWINRLYSLIIVFKVPFYRALLNAQDVIKPLKSGPQRTKRQTQTNT